MHRNADAFPSCIVGNVLECRRIRMNHRMQRSRSSEDTKHRRASALSWLRMVGMDAAWRAAPAAVVAAAGHRVQGGMAAQPAQRRSREEVGVDVAAARVLRAFLSA